MRKIFILFFLIISCDCWSQNTLKGQKFLDISEISYFRNMEEAGGGYETGFEIAHEIFILKQDSVNHIVVVTEFINDSNQIIDTINVPVHSNQLIFFGTMASQNENKAKYRILLLEKVENDEYYTKTISSWVFFGLDRLVMKEEDKNLSFGKFSGY